MWTWVRLALALINLGKGILREVDKRQLLNAGEQRIVLQTLQAVAEAVRIGKDVDLGVEQLTDDQVTKELGEDFRD